MIATMLGMMLMLSTIVPVIQAENSAPDVSGWAIETLNEGEKYGIFPLEWYYDGFRSEASIERVNELLALTEKKIAALQLPENKQYSPVSFKGDTTRGDIVNRLYNIVARYDLPVGKDAVAYMAERNILKGSSSGFDLEKKATTQHAVILAIRLIQDTYQIAEQGAKGVAWVVEDEDTLVYLLGSIHIGTPDLYPFDKKLLTAFNESDALLVEVNTIAQEGVDYYVEKAMYAEGTTLKDKVSAETYAKIEKVAELYKLPLEQLVMQKPWTLASGISMLSADDSFGMTAEEMVLHGIDNYFLLNAFLQEKPIIELEGMKAQVDMFEGLSAETQEQYLLASLNGILEPSAENDTEVLQGWFSSWKKGDTLAFTESFKEMEGEASEFTEMLFGLRDEQMAKKIISLLKDKEGTYFVVVGAGHFVIEKSIRYHLEQSGYKVEPFYQ